MRSARWSPPAQVQWGLIGCGDVCEVKSGPAFQRVSGSSAVIAFRRDAKRCQDFALRHGIPEWTTDFGRALERSNAIYVATPPNSHAEYTIAALRAGKAVYVEKPMALNGAECDAMLAASEESGAPLFVAYYRRSWSHIHAVREWIRSGRIGSTLSTRLRYRTAANGADWRTNPSISGGGLLHDLGSHALDLLDFLLGPLRAIHSLTERRGPGEGCPDFTHATLSSDFGPVDAEWNFHSGDRMDEIEIAGSAGKISLQVFGGAPARLMQPDGKLVEAVPPEKLSAVQEPLIREVVGAILHGNDCASTGITAARTTRLLDIIGHPSHHF